MGRFFEYAILRFVPESFRGELINIGIVALRGYGIDVRVFLNASLFKAMGVSLGSLEWVPAYLRELDDPSMETPARWERLAKIPGFVLSQPGWLTAETDEQYETRIERIRQDYIERPKLPAARKISTSLIRELRNTFRQHRVLGKNSEDIERHKVVSNVPVGPAGKLHIDFVVKNGVYHATETADFRAAHDTGIPELRQAALAAITLQCARQALRNGTKCYLVYSASPFVEQAIRPALQITEPTVDMMFNLSSDEQKRDYLDLILSAAGAPPLPLPDA